MSEFIFMLTRNDETVPDAVELLERALATDVQHFGFKDVGVDSATMHELVSRIHAAQRVAHLEVVSLSEDDELTSAQFGLELGVDYLIGGVRWQRVGALVHASGLKYFPYPGEITGHPAVLRGTAESIASDARAMRDHVDGINLLAYRHDSIGGDQILRQVLESTDQPVICAGSVNSVERVQQIAKLGTWAFTIGQAVLDGVIVPDGALEEQLDAVLEAARV